VKFDCIGRKLKVGDYVSFLMYWSDQKMTVGKITRLCNFNVRVTADASDYWTDKKTDMKNYYVNPSFTTKIEDGPDLLKYLITKD